MQMKAAMVAAGKQRRKTMRVLTEGELMRATRTELWGQLRRIAGELPNLPEGSAEVRAAHANLQNIRRPLARPDFRRRSRPRSRCRSLAPGKNDVLPGQVTGLCGVTAATPV
ncbi:hypothetical protein ACVWWO_006414 [Bradyrhizobium sp. F1.13.1]